MICFSFGKYGHVTEDCGEKNMVATGTVNPVENNASVGANEKNNETNTRVAETGGNKFGPWMIVSRKNKPRNYFGKNYSHGAIEDQPFVHQSKSRFVVLASQDPGDNKPQNVATDIHEKGTSHADRKHPSKHYAL